MQNHSQSAGADFLFKPSETEIEVTNEHMEHGRNGQCGQDGAFQTQGSLRPCFGAMSDFHQDQFQNTQNINPIKYDNTNHLSQAATYMAAPPVQQMPVKIEDDDELTQAVAEVKNINTSPSFAFNKNASSVLNLVSMHEPHLPKDPLDMQNQFTAPAQVPLLGQQQPQLQNQLISSQSLSVQDNLCLNQQQQQQFTSKTIQSTNKFPVQPQLTIQEQVSSSKVDGLSRHENSLRKRRSNSQSSGTPSLPMHSDKKSEKKLVGSPVPAWQKKHVKSSLDSFPMQEKEERDYFITPNEPSEEEDQSGMDQMMPHQFVIKFGDELFSDISFSQGQSDQSELTSIEFAPQADDFDINLYEDQLFPNNEDSGMAKSAPALENLSNCKDEIQEDLIQLQSAQANLSENENQNKPDDNVSYGAYLLSSVAEKQDDQRMTLLQQMSSFQQESSFIVDSNLPAVRLQASDMPSAPKPNQVEEQNKKAVIGAQDQVQNPNNSTSKKDASQAFIDMDSVMMFAPSHANRFTSMKRRCQHVETASVMANRSQFTQPLTKLFRNMSHEKETECKEDQDECHHNHHNYATTLRASQQFTEERAYVIHLVDQQEVRSDNMDNEAENDDFNFNIEEGDEQAYQSEPEINQPVLEVIEEKPPPIVKVGQKRRRKRDLKNRDENGNKLPNRITNCPHTDRKFYAKGMCRNCYHKVGRTKMASCHPERPLYSKGLCQNCYMRNYTKQQRSEAKKARESAKLSSQASAMVSDKIQGSGSAAATVKNPAAAAQTTAKQTPAQKKRAGKQNSVVSKETSPTVIPESSKVSVSPANVNKISNLPQQVSMQQPIDPPAMGIDTSMRPKPPTNRKNSLASPSVSMTKSKLQNQILLAQPKATNDDMPMN